MICLEGVSKRYEDTQTEALQNISLQIETGEFVFLTGESGSGKTTLLRLLLREFLPEEGRIRVNGKYLDEMGRREIPFYRRKIGMLYQDSKLIENKTVYENVLLARQIAGAGRKEAKNQVSRMLAFTGLASRFRQYPNELSGGEQKKACLARALVNHPALLLADEPTGNLDESGTQELMNVLEEMNRRGVTVLVATHDLEQIGKRGHRVVRLEGGRCI